MQATLQLINCQASQSKSRLFYVFFNEVDNFFGWCARSEDSFYASFFQAWDIGFRNYAAANYENVAHSFSLQCFNNFREEGVVSAGEQGQSYNINVFCVCCFNDLFNGLAKTGVNNFHACITKCTSNNFCATIMSIKTRFSYQYSDTFVCHCKLPPEIFE